MNTKYSAWFLILALALIPLHARAQQQPRHAANRQDEVVNVDIKPGQGADDVLRILRSDDKTETNNYATRAYEIRNTTAYELKPFIEGAVEKEKGRVQAVVTGQGGAARQFLVVTTTPNQQKEIERTIRVLDVQGLVNDAGTTRFAFRVKHRLASELLQVIAKTRGTAQTNGYADDLTNSLYFDDSASVIGDAARFVAFYDVPAPQIEFDIRIIEARQDDTRKLGLDWDAWKRSLGGQFTFTGNIFEGGSRYARLDSLLTLDASTLADFLNYAAQRGSARIVKRSRLTASNLKPAVIYETRHIPAYDYVSRDKAAGVVTESNTETNGTRTAAIVPPTSSQKTDLGQDDEGLYVKIQPVIGTESVLASVNIEVNTLSGYDPQDRPLVSRQALNNEFTLQNGQTLLLGTIEREQWVDSRRGIPGLKDIPGVQYLFSVESRQKTTSRVFLLATPKLSNVSYGAATIGDLVSQPPLNIKPAEAAIDDGKAREQFDEQSANN